MNRVPVASANTVIWSEFLIHWNVKNVIRNVLHVIIQLIIAVPANKMRY